MFFLYSFQIHHEEDIAALAFTMRVSVAGEAVQGGMQERVTLVRRPDGVGRVEVLVLSRFFVCSGKIVFFP